MMTEQTKMVCSNCGEEHQYNDAELDDVEYILIECGCGINTRIYAEIDPSNAPICDHLNDSSTGSKTE